MNLSKNVKLTVCSGAAAAAQTAITGSILDMAGFDGVLFIALTGDVTVNCVLTLIAQQDTDSAMGAAAALTGTATFTAGATDADSKVLMLDVTQPRERYVRPQLTRTAADAVIGGILAIQYSAQSRPTTQDATVIASNLIVAPSES